VGIYVDGKLTEPKQNTQADEALKVAVEQWQKDHPNTMAVAPTSDRKETVLTEEKTFKITGYSDGTIRRDNFSPPAPKPAPVTVDTLMVHTLEDQARLHQGGVSSATVTADGKFIVSEPGASRDAEQQKTSGANWLTKGTPREEAGDHYRKP
jgi:hypothetical protein